MMDLLEFLRVEAEGLVSQNEALRRDNIEYAAHGASSVKDDVVVLVALRSAALAQDTRLLDD